LRDESSLAIFRRFDLFDRRVTAFVLTQLRIDEVAAIRCHLIDLVVMLFVYSNRSERFYEHQILRKFFGHVEFGRLGKMKKLGEEDGVREKKSISVSGSLHLKMYKEIGDELSKN